MQISQLADRTGVSVPTVKFYLREGLLAPGVATSATRSTYDESHVRRLRLVRALVEVGGLKLAAVREVLGALDDPDRSQLEWLGAAHDPLSGDPADGDRTAPAEGADTADETRLAEVDAILARLGWSVHPRSGARPVLARALAACADVGHPVDPSTLDVYAQAARLVAEVDVASVPTHDRAAAMERVVVGTVLYEPVLLALRRLAQAAVSAERVDDK